MMEFTVSDQAFDLIVIGGGSGGLACAQRAAEFGAKAAVIESHRLGGTCVNVGCVPKKVMWNAASVALSLADASDYGFKVTIGDNDWPLLKRKRDAYVLRLNGIYERNLESKGVKYVRGAARFLDKGTVEVNAERLTARHIVIATGGKAHGAGAARRGAGHHIGRLLLSSGRRPKRVAVVGSGYVACELAGAFRELGTEVELFIRKEHLLMSFDAMLGKSLMREMREQGIDHSLRTSCPRRVREDSRDSRP
jgi:glutathione reductase (NADPH)